MISIIFTISFFVAWLFGIFITAKRIFCTDEVPYLSIRYYSLVILFCGIIMPIFEESLFRCSYPVLFGHLFINQFYFKLVNAIAFGLIHLTNYFVTKDIIGTLYQSFLTLFLGWYLIELNSLYDAIIFHIAYNCIGLIIAATMIWIRDRYYPNKNILKPYNPNCISVCYNPIRLTRSSSSPNIKGYKRLYDDIRTWKYMVIDIKDIHPDIKESVVTYENICDKKGLYGMIST